MVQVYNYLLQNYPINRDIQYRASKRSELKKVYNSIVTINKQSPYYKVNLSKENQEYTLGIKETAILLKSKLNEISDVTNNSFSSKRVDNTNDKVLSAELTGGDTDRLPQALTFRVDTLANGQINKGKELLNTSRALEWGTYNFTANVLDDTYNLTYSIPDRIENKAAQKQMADLLNQSVPGITASVEVGKRSDYSRIVVQSEFTGSFGEKSFSFEDEGIYPGVVDFFGLNRVEQPASNAKFDINGASRETASNTFLLENVLQITLSKASDEPGTVRVVPDSDKILSQVNSLLDTYNGLIQIAKSRKEESNEHFRASKLINDMKSLEKHYQEELEAVGIKAEEDGTLSLDEALASQAAEDGGMESLFKRENGFIARVLDKAQTITINPLDYLDKTIVTYPGKDRAAFTNPYVTSMYSGLLFSSYC